MKTVHPVKHFKTITHHKLLVMGYCFQLGLYWQGLCHDLSKYSWREFWTGARYFRGDRSPNGVERDEKGWSEAWMHHKGRNRHHYEYWTDLSMETGRYESVPMPRKYMVEMVLDRIAACKNYQGRAYTAASPLEYLEKSRERSLLHPQTRRELEHILTMLREQGQRETFRYLRGHVLKGKPFPWETNV